MEQHKGKMQAVHQPALITKALMLKLPSSPHKIIMEFPSGQWIKPGFQSKISWYESCRQFECHPFIFPSFLERMAPIYFSFGLFERRRSALLQRKKNRSTSALSLGPKPILLEELPRGFCVRLSLMGCLVRLQLTSLPALVCSRDTRKRFHIYCILFHLVFVSSTM